MSTTIFTGSSSYSSDFQSVITRSVAIASLPIKQLTADKTTLTSQSTELATMDTTFTSLQTSLDGVAAALRGSSFDTEVSDPDAISVSLSDGAIEGNYSVNVVDAGAYATSLSSAAWTAAAGAAHTFQLKVGASTYDVTPADNSAASVAAALNAQQGDKVRATVVNVGSASSPDYRISLRAAALGDATLDLADNGVSFQTEQQQGRLASYEVNGSGLTITSTSRNVSIASGVNVNLLEASAGAVNVTVTRSTSSLSQALSSFATAYNAAVDAVDHERGQSAGVLQGQSVVRDLSQVLSGISTYGDLSKVGLTLDSAGHLTFNSFALLGADISNSAGVTSFLGAPESGGFLKNAADALSRVSISAVKSDIDSQITSLDATIATKQSAVDDLQVRLEAQMAAADALIASLEQQYTYLSSVFAAQQTASEQYK